MSKKKSKARKEKARSLSGVPAQIATTSVRTGFAMTDRGVPAEYGGSDGSACMGGQGRPPLRGLSGVPAEYGVPARDCHVASLLAMTDRGVPAEYGVPALRTEASAAAGVLSEAAAVGVPVIGAEQVREAYTVLQKYKSGKVNLEHRLIRNEQWYKLRHWEYLRRQDKNGEQVEPVSAWLFNAIANKHADAMDNFPSANLLPREQDDVQEAKLLSAIVPVLLQQCDFEQVYSDAWDDKLKGGTAVYGVFWDGTALNGLGDIAVRCIDPLNLFWQPGVSDIQKSRNVFHVELQDNDHLIEQWPQLQGKLGANGAEVSRYVYDDSVDTSGMSAVVDWYYRRQSKQGRTVLHYCKFVGDEVLFASENLPEFAERGWYDHGQYPFIFDPLFRVKGSPCGFGFIDVAKSAQEYVDRGNQAILKNMLANATPRHFIRSDGAVNEEEYLDLTKPLIHVDGQLGQDSILPVQVNALSSIYVQILNNKIDELKETTGNRDISTGGTSNGVTAASAIAAMQEAGSKLTRDSNKAAYRAFRKVVVLVIELIRQFYDMPRCFRIVGQNGTREFVRYSNQRLIAQAQGTEFGVELGYRLPLFDIEVTAQKASAYSKLNQNELALQFFGAGFFRPELAQQALACLDMMDFDRKDFVMQRIAENGAHYQAAAQEQNGIPRKIASASLGEAARTRQARTRVADAAAPK